MERIEARTLIPGSGEPIQDGVIIFEGASISYVGSAAEAPVTKDAIVTEAAVVMPGMWDCHTHLMGMPSFDIERLPLVSESLRAARSVVDLRAALNAGVTSVRELGGLGVHLRKAVAEGTIDGPSIYPAGAILSITGGHGDIHSLPLGFVHELARRGPDLRICDGVDDCMRAVREQLRLDAKVIKVCASGGFFSEVDHPIHQQFTKNELRAIVEVAGLADRVVAAHCHGKPGIMAALEAGARTIEHGTYLDEEACDGMRETGAILVATRTVADDVLADPALPPHVEQKMREIEGRHRDAIALAYERGVTIAAGSDIALMARGRSLSWGRHGREPQLLTEIGMSPLEAIAAVTATAPATLGPQAPRSGILRAGYDADIVILDSDPIADISVLADPERVVGVWKAGVRLKG